MYRVIALLFAVCILAGVAAGAEPASAYERLKPMEWFIGEWSGQYTATFDLGGIKKGARVTAVASSRWALDKGMMITDFADEVDGKKVLTSFEMIGIEPGAKRPVHWIFGPLGNGKGEWLEVGPKAVLRWRVDLAEGKLEGTSYLEMKTADTYTWQARGVTLAGKNLPDFPVVTYARKKASPEGAAPGAGYEHMKFLQFMAGNWRTEYSVDGKKSLGEFRAKWGPGKSSLIWSARNWYADDGKEFMQASGIIAWDPAERKVRELATFADGTVGTAYFEQQDGKLVITRSGALADGTRFTTRPVGVLTKDRMEFGPSEWTAPDGKVLQKIGGGAFIKVSQPK